MAQKMTNENNETQDKYLFHRKAIVIAFSILVILIILLDTYYDQKKPREPLPLIPITLTPPPEIPEKLFSQEQGAAGPAQGSLSDEQ